jgi:hypothetical protein
MQLSDTFGAVVAVALTVSLGLSYAAHWVVEESHATTWEEAGRFLVFDAPRRILPEYYARLDAEQGAREAADDLEAGNLGFRFYGRPAPWRNAQAALLQSQYGISVDVVATCFVDADVYHRAEGYNAVMLERITALHGPGILELTS